MVMATLRVAPKNQGNYLLVLVVLFAVCGIVLLLAAAAAPDGNRGFEAETGTLSNAQPQAGSGVSGNSFVTLQGGGQSGPLGFTEVLIDGGNSGDCKIFDDLDGDGDLDGGIGGSALTLYQNPGGQNNTWAKKSIATANSEFTTDCQSGDVDNDGDIDIIVPDNGVMDIIINPGNAAAFTGNWQVDTIGPNSGYYHDVAAGDVNSDGRLDFIARREGQLDLWLNGASGWTSTGISNRGGEGTIMGDVDTDGDLDIMIGGYWLENNGSGGGWAEHTIVATEWGSIGVADVNKDGKNDVVIGPIEASGTDIKWYSATDPKGSWTAHTIAANTGDGYHTLRMADMNGDSLPDVVIGKMSTRSPSPVEVYVNENNGASWSRLQVSDKGTHNSRVGDVEGDGDIDIFGSNFIGNNGVYLWRNTSR